jgi:predicted O-methyltransferase YrrM
MTPGGKFLALTPALYDYVVAHGRNHDPILAELVAETARLGPIASMQTTPEQGTFMEMIVRLIGARNAVEVGTFTGHSSTCVARGLGPEGRLLCCDVSAEWTSIAHRFWEKAGVASMITLRLGPALKTLRALPVAEIFDFAFIDADKVNYRNYYEEILRRLRPNGLIVVDNVLWGGSVVNPANQNEDTRAIREFNDLVMVDGRVDVVMLPVADGLTLARKR